jgi:hypothetical protein
MRCSTLAAICAGLQAFCPAPLSLGLAGCKLIIVLTWATTESATPRRTIAMGLVKALTVK